MSDLELKELVASLAVAQAQTDAQLRETDVQLRETDRIVRENARLQKRLQEETNRQMQETDRKLRRLEGLFHNAWGDLVEALVSPRCLALFRQRGIAVEEAMRRVLTTRAGTRMEVDVVLVNDADLVAVEVKTKCHVQDVRDHLAKLARFRAAFPGWSGRRLLGAMAALSYAEASDVYAQRHGLFVIRSDGVDLALLNPPGFQPRAF